MSNGTSKLVQTKKNEKKDTKDETEKKERRKGRVNVKSLKKMKVDEFIADIEAIEKRRFWHGVCGDVATMLIQSGNVLSCEVEVGSRGRCSL